MIEITDIVLGCSYGDEGKGKVVYDLLKKNKYDLCVRFNGSGNIGHTVYEEEEKYIVHQLPIGVLVKNVYNLISGDCLIDIARLKTEINELKEKRINIEDRLFISKACHIITQECIQYNNQDNLIENDSSGIDTTYACKMLRTGKRVEDFAEDFDDLGIQLVDMRKFWFKEAEEKQIKNVLIEGAQGFEMDINWTNNYPYCASSTCSLGGAINIGIPLKSIRDIYGVAKAYDTCVDSMKFQPDIYKEEVDLIVDIDQEYGSVSGRRTQCNFLNIDNLIESLKINNCTICIINKIDIIDKAGIYKLYYRNELISFRNLIDMQSFICNVLFFLERGVFFSFNPYYI
jgi:adenylosuccinate synthase